MNKSKKRRLADGIALMTVSGLVVKAAGLFYKVPLTRMIGEEGMGYYSSAYALFTWIYMLTSSGLPSAASVMIASYGEKHRLSAARRVLGVSLMLFTSAGLLLGAMMYFGADGIAHVMRMEKAAPALRAVAPTLVFVSAASAFRGYFQGMGRFGPHSAAQVTEAVFKVVIGVTAAKILTDAGRSPSETAAGAAVGITAGTLAGVLVLIAAYAVCRKDGGTCRRESFGAVAARLVKKSFPIALSSGVMSLAGIMDSFIMSRSLHASGLSQAECAAVFGNYSSLAVPFFNLPQVLTLPVAYALLPALSGAVSMDDGERARGLCADAFRRTLMLSVPCAVGMCAMAEPVLAMLFGDAMAERGALMLSLLAPSSAMLCVLSLFNTVLQACAHERLPLVSMLAGGCAKLAATSVLTPHIGKFATPVSTFVCYFTAALISYIFIVRKTRLRKAFGGEAFLIPTLLSLISVGGAAAAYPFIGTAPSVAIAAAAYFPLYSLYYKGKIKSERKHSQNERTY